MRKQVKNSSKNKPIIDNNNNDISSKKAMASANGKEGSFIKDVGQDMAKNKENEPILLPRNDRFEKSGPPYILIALMLFGILGAFWKMIIQKDRASQDIVNSKPAKTAVINSSPGR